MNIPIYADNANAIAPYGANGTGHMRTVPIAIHGIIIISDKIPADQIIPVAIAILINTIFPADIIQQITRINAAIAVVIQHIARIGGPVQVPKCNQPIRINV